MTDQQLPDRNGDVIDDIVIALTRRGDLSPEHRAFYESILDRFEALTSERDRLRTAWESARRGRAQAYRQLDDARRWGRTLEAQRADLRQELRGARAAGRLPEEDMVEPGVEVTDLRELADRVAAIEQRLDEESAQSYSQGVEDMREQAMRAASDAPGTPYTPTEAIRDLSLTDTTEQPPTRYRDRDGDLWEETSPGHLFLSIRGMTGRPYAVVADEFGPLTPVTTVEPPAPCEVCGRAPDEQEHGPDGQCRHTPATRLGRPTTTTGDTK